ncbi:rRNA pseudouridine synthase [Gammaproteobacteria bacterium]|jgi:23S rRNA pseudouridine2605 synthase|nr:rRNA pseudouridine synthase [Gammaproteobacteria bacterium]MDA9971389.1 rRNA pseudouridine synthase [Gammaproteobacteria bacterium]MDB0042262.1 rRNA pseudouridine synthase [Gammaproteobacteria bacterium]MDB4843628.1 rRNA pseudouridine synthase [Gammaproteobacteria bacterium]MDC0365297.1 rRNA pseudouridine synthase [Gammaproteobacteria bacterium]|tara:strand:- start:1042 stop:1764 length:723 start_codon:yes stop_codon:yes gene_type:complete
MLRLQKYLAQAGLGSRRSCEQLIKDKKILVNGNIAELGAKVSESDEVYYEGKKVSLKIADLKVIMLNKPPGVLSSRKDEKKIKLVFDYLPKTHNEPDWIAVGRLDINTSGLMLFTNDGTLAHQLMHPSFEVDREYLVRARGNFDEQKKKNMLAGVTIEDEIYKFSDVVPGEKQSSNQWFSVCMLTGKNREVRKLFESQDLEVSRLKRVRIGPIFLPSTLREGACANLTESQIKELQEYGK